MSGAAEEQQEEPHHLQTETPTSSSTLYGGEDAPSNRKHEYINSLSQLMKKSPGFYD